MYLLYLISMPTGSEKQGKLVKKIPAGKNQGIWKFGLYIREKSGNLKMTIKYQGKIREFYQGAWYRGALLIHHAVGHISVPLMNTPITWVGVSRWGNRGCICHYIHTNQHACVMLCNVVSHHMLQWQQYWCQILLVSICGSGKIREFHVCFSVGTLII